MTDYPSLNLGELPVDRINRTIGTVLVAGHVTVSKKAHQHMAEKHSAEYAEMMEALPGMIANPAFIGRDPAHPHAFYLVDSLETKVGSFALVAIAFERSPEGTYKVASAYGLKATQFTSRVKAGRVVPLLP